MSEQLSDPEIRHQSLSLELTALRKTMAEIKSIQIGLSDPDKEPEALRQLEALAAEVSLSRGKHFKIEGHDTQKLILDLESELLAEIQDTEQKLADSSQIN